METNLSLTLQDDIIFVVAGFQAPDGNKIIISGPVDYSRALGIAKSFNIPLPETIKEPKITFDTYVLVECPESQKFMEEEWFRTEAVLHPDLSSAYFIPSKYMK